MKHEMHPILLRAMRLITPLTALNFVILTYYAWLFGQYEYVIINSMLVLINLVLVAASWVLFTPKRKGQTHVTTRHW